MQSLENRNLMHLEPLVSPAALKEATPATAEAAWSVLQGREAIRDALDGRDTERLVAIVGPCSLHDHESALAYAERLAPLRERLAGELVIVMRTYFEKPRTTVGWKGLINDPRLDGSCDIEAGLALARRILLDVNAHGLPCASEILDPVTPQYLADLLSWVAIGARTTESQTHREMASGLSMPVGFKNGTGGGITLALNAMTSAAAAHRFLGVSPEGRSAIVSTTGNRLTHLVLRGGANGPNHDAPQVDEAVARVESHGIARGVLVDCSHDNSGKDPTRQGAVLEDVVGQFVAGQRGILGVMLESHLEPGRQDWSPGRPLTPGVSITDGCIGFDETEALLDAAAERIRAGRTPSSTKAVPSAA